MTDDVERLFMCLWPFIYLLADFFLIGEKKECVSMYRVLFVISPFPTPVVKEGN